MVSLSGPSGCGPAVRQTFKVKTHRCVAFYSNLMKIHNRKMKKRLRELRSTYPKVTILERRHFNDMHRAVLNPKHAGK